MYKNIKLKLQNPSVILFSPKCLKLRENFDFLSNKMIFLKKLMDKSKFVIFRMDLNEYNFIFSDGPIDNQLLHEYDYYLKRSIIVKNNELLFCDSKELDNYNPNNNFYKIDLESGFYVVHIFAKKDNIYYYFEKSKPFKTNVQVPGEFEILTDNETRRRIYSAKFNNFMLNAYYDSQKEEDIKRFTEKDNNFVFNLGKLKITSGKIVIIDASNSNDVLNVLNSKECLNMEIPKGEYPVLLSMRKSYYYGNYNTGIKIVIKDKEVNDYVLAKTNMNRSNFNTSTYYCGITDLDALNDYYSIRQTFDVLQKKESELTKAFDAARKKYKKIVDTHNYFLLWDIPEKDSNIALINLELGVNNYNVYYGLDEEENIVNIYIPLINNSIFKYKEFTLKNNIDGFVDDKINEIRTALNDYIEYLKKIDRYNPDVMINIPALIQKKIEEVIFEIKDLKLEHKFVYKFIELFDEYPNIGFYLVGNSIYQLIYERYDQKEIIEKLLENPTSYKIYLLTRYLFLNNYKNRENKELFKLLKKLSRSKNQLVKYAAKRRYKELTVEDRKKRKKGIIISLAVIFLCMILDAFFPVLHYKTLADNDNYMILSHNINSVNNKYRVYYNLVDNGYEHTKMEKNEVWFSLEYEDYKKDKRIKVSILNENINDYKKKILENKNFLCTSDTEYSHIECFNEVEDEKYKINNISYYYLGFTFVENDSYNCTLEYLLYKIDEENTLIIINDGYNISQEEFLSLTKDIVASIKIKK